MKMRDIKNVDVIAIKNPLNPLAATVKNAHLLSNREMNMNVYDVTIDGKTAICRADIERREESNILEKMCRESYKKLSRAEKMLGIDSPEANISRAEWYAFDRAYRLVFKESLDYFNNTKTM